MGKEEEIYHDFSNVEKQRDYLIPEEFPEGPFGSSRAKDEPVQNKNTPWQEGQRYQSAFNFENKSLHEDLPRKYPGAHPTHDDPENHEQPPYKGYGSS